MRTLRIAAALALSLLAARARAQVYLHMNTGGAWSPNDKKVQLKDVASIWPSYAKYRLRSVNYYNVTLKDGTKYEDAADLELQRGSEPRRVPIESNQKELRNTVGAVAQIATAHFGQGPWSEAAALDFPLRQLAPLKGAALTGDKIDIDTARSGPWNLPEFQEGPVKRWWPEAPEAPHETPVAHFGQHR